MNALMLYLHLLSTAAWFGGGLAGMTLAIAVRREPVSVRALTFQLLARIHTRLVAPGALVSVLTGLGLTMSLAMSGGATALGTTGVIVMQGAGLLAGILVLFLGLPLANKIMRLAGKAGEALPPEFEEARKQQAIIQTVAGVLILVAFYAAIM